MNINRFSVLLDGWSIIKNYKDSRESARMLCRWLADLLNAAEVVLEFHSLDGAYSWVEQINRVGIDSTSGEWERPLPIGISYWRFRGGEKHRKELEPVLDLLSELWLRFPGRIEKKKNILKKIKYQLNINMDWVAVSPVSQELLLQLYPLYSSFNPVLLVGENGCGKRYIANMIHNNGYDPAKPFFEWGHHSNSGTVYVPHWDKLSIKEKKSLLNSNHRVIAAIVPSESADAYRQKWKLITTDYGSFLKVPPLRERREDIPILVNQFINLAALKNARPVPGITTGAIDALVHYSWPGNIRELEETIVRLLNDYTQSENGINLIDLPANIRGCLLGEAESSFIGRMAALEYEAVKEELLRQRGNITQTAKALGMTARQISWRVKKYGFNIKDSEFKKR